jgi:Tol biopolymer transport system component
MAPLKQWWFVVCLASGCSGTSMTPDGGAGGGSAGHFTYTVGTEVFRLAASATASPENVSVGLARFGASTRDRWLTSSPNGRFLALSTERLNCSLGECLAIAAGDLSTLLKVTPSDSELTIEGTPAVSDDGATVVFSSSDGPHEVDLWLTHHNAAGWGQATLLTGASTYAYNNMPALTLDGARVLFDCGRERYPESGGNDACRVGLDGTGFSVVVQPSTLPDARQSWVQFPRDSPDGVLFESSWPIGNDTPETIWQLGTAGPPTPIGRALTNAVSPCALRDGRFAVLWLGRAGNTDGKHELTLLARDGSLIATLTPGVDVEDIGIGCGD